MSGFCIYCTCTLSCTVVNANLAYLCIAGKNSNPLLLEINLNQAFTKSNRPCNQELIALNEVKDTHIELTPHSNSETLDCILFLRNIRHLMNVIIYLVKVRNSRLAAHPTWRSLDSQNIWSQVSRGGRRSSHHFLWLMSHLGALDTCRAANYQRLRTKQQVAAGHWRMTHDALLFHFYLGAWFTGLLLSWSGFANLWCSVYKPWQLVPGQFSNWDWKLQMSSGTNKVEKESGARVGQMRHFRKSLNWWKGLCWIYSVIYH